MKREKLCLIGCGWLGKPLAKDLLAEEYPLLALTAHDKSSEFGVENIPYLHYDLSLNSPLPKEVEEADILIYTVPPLEFSTVKNFFDKISLDKKIIFTSSTSVYGKNLGVVDENFKLDFKNTSSPLLVQTEEYLQSRFKNLTTIRPGGLYGDKRHPIFFLQGKKDLTTGNEYLHLAHQKDCINAIVSIIKKGIWGEILNLVNDLRIYKKDYYIEIAKKLNLSPPSFNEGQKTLNQTKISNEKSKNLLEMNYLDPNQY